MTKHYLVTGGSGFIGSALVRRLVTEGRRVTVLDNNSRGDARRLAGVECKFIQADIRDREAVMQACRGVDSVLHLAYVNGTEFFYSRPHLVLDVGVKGIVNVVDGCLEHHVGELVLASSSEVYQTPPTIPTPEGVPLVVPDVHNPRYSYGAGKIISEVMALSLGDQISRVLIFRPHNVYGPDMGSEHVIPQLIRKCVENSQDGKARISLQGDGSQTRAFIYIDDFVEGLWQVLQQGRHRQIYHIGSDAEVSIADLVREIAAALNLTVEFEAGPAPAGGTQRRCPDIGKLRELGFAPKISLRQGVAETVVWYRAQLQAQVNS